MINAVDQEQDSSPHRSTLLNRLLLALCVPAWLVTVLLYFTSVADAVITAVALIVAIVTYLFPRIKESHRQSWFHKPLTTALLSIAFAIGSMLDIYLWLRPEQIVINSNRLITYHDFENTDNGWSVVTGQERGADGNTKSAFPDDVSFPGFFSSKLTKDYHLTGQGSMKVTTSINAAGEYKVFLWHKGTITANGIMIYVLAPELPDVSVSYIQLCVPSHNWACSYGTKFRPGEWTPITLDLSQTDKNDDALYNQKVEVAIQWWFSAKHSTSFDLYFDSAEIFRSDSQ